MSSTSQGKTRSRNPPPALFSHPSPGALHVSNSGYLSKGGKPGQHALVPRTEHPQIERSTLVRSGSMIPPDTSRNARYESTRSTDKTDALWAEMQATLEEVELSASCGTHVFGPGHDQKLSELRSAQIGLAQAWARSEADEVGVAALRDKAIPSAGGNVRNMRSTFDSSQANAESDTDRAQSINRLHDDALDGNMDRFDQLESQLKEENEMDIVLGRKRREANDRYFQRVNDGVVDVVAKLQEVAVAMRAVEQESQHVWDESKAVDEI